MKKLWIVIAVALLAAGCSGPSGYETVEDVYAEQTLPAPQQVSVLLPADASVQTMEKDGETLYLCDGYSVILQTMESGDLDATLRTVTGYEREKLSVMEIEGEALDRYECIWLAAGEGGDQMGRAVILDDGNYHYTVSLLADAEQVGALAETWQDILSSINLNIGQ